MIGGEFIVHGQQQKARIDVADPTFPGAERFGSSFEILDEWYALKNFQDDLHVILVQNTEDMEKTKGGDRAYNRPNFPETWARMHGKGRVFYTSMGHREDVWENPLYQGLLIGALNWATGKVDASIEPNVIQGHARLQGHPGVNSPRRRAGRSRPAPIRSARSSWRVGVSIGGPPRRRPRRR